MWKAQSLLYGDLLHRGLRRARAHTLRGVSTHPAGPGTPGIVTCTQAKEKRVQQQQWGGGVWPRMSQRLLPPPFATKKSAAPQPAPATESFLPAPVMLSTT